MEGFEPPTRWLQISCSGQLSYIGIFNSRTLVIVSPFVAGVGFEPTSFGLWDRAGASPVHPAIFYFLLSSKFISPAWISLWQFEQTRIHLSSSFLTFSKLLIYPPSPIPKSFSSGFKWWNSNAPLYLSYPQHWHLPPLYSIAISFIFSRLLCTNSTAHFLQR